MRKKLKKRRKLARAELLRVAAYRLANRLPLPADVLAYVKRNATGDTPAYVAAGIRKAKGKGDGDFYLSDAWLKLRYQALELHGAVCQCCGASRATGAVIHVDHIKPRARFPKLALVLSNLQVLCGGCNIGKGATLGRDWRP